MPLGPQRGAEAEVRAIHDPKTRVTPSAANMRATSSPPFAVAVLFPKTAACETHGVSSAVDERTLPHVNRSVNDQLDRSDKLLNKRAMTRRARAPAPPSSTEARILEAAEELFCSAGYTGVSARGLCRARGREQGARLLPLRQHARPLRGRARALLRGAPPKGLADALAGGGSVRERMHRLVDAYSIS